MTYEEVKRIRDNPSSEDVDNDELSRMIDNAIDKRIAIKPVIVRAYLCDFQDFYCPMCYKKIISKIYGEWIFGRKQSYCDDCGQKLDWSDNE